MQENKLGFKKKTGSKVLILDNSRKKEHISTTPLSAAILLFTSVYMSEGRKQFCGDSTKTLDRYTFKNVIHPPKKKTKHELGSQIILNLNPIYAIS